MNDANTICTNGKMKTSASGASSRCQALGRRRRRLRGAATSIAAAAGRLTASDDIELPPARVADLHQHERDDGDEEHAGDGCPEALLPVHEAELVAVDDDHRRRIDRASALGRPRDVEE